MMEQIRKKIKQIKINRRFNKYIKFLDKKGFHLFDWQIEQLKEFTKGKRIVFNIPRASTKETYMKLMDLLNDAQKTIK